MFSVGLKSPGSANAALINDRLSELIELVDVVGISVYPYVVYDHADKGNPANLPGNWLSQITTIANGKSVAIAETGWPAGQLEIPSFRIDVVLLYTPRLARIDSYVMIGLVRQYPTM